MGCQGHPESKVEEGKTTLRSGNTTRLAADLTLYFATASHLFEQQAATMDEVATSALYTEHASSAAPKVN